MLILTAGFASADFAMLEVLRQRHFPPARNFIPVHVTLFQQLPPTALNALQADVARIAETTSPVAATVTAVVDYQAGTALALDAPALTDLHEGLRALWADRLTDGDARARDWHVTLQSRAKKAAVAAARAEAATCVGRRMRLPRLDLWHYRGGPWERAGRYPLRGSGGIE